MPEKDAMDLEVMDRIRAHVRLRMRERQLGVNAMARKLGVGSGYLSRVLTSERGFGPGFVRRVHRELTIPGDVLLDDDPPQAYFEPAAWDWTRPLRTRAEIAADAPNPSVAPPTAQPVGRTSGGRH